MYEAYVFATGRKRHVPVSVRMEITDTTEATTTKSFRRLSQQNKPAAIIRFCFRSKFCLLSQYRKTG
jgi:hypothetical protein